MSECGIEYSLHDDDLENDLHGRMNDGLDGCTLSRSKMGCCSNACDHNQELGGWWFRGGWLWLWSQLVVGLKVQVDPWPGWVVLVVHDQLVDCPQVHLVQQQWVGVCLVSRV